MERKRSFNLDNLTPQQADRVSIQIGKAVAVILDDCNEECGKLLKSFGYQTAIKHETMVKGSKELKKLKKRRSKKRSEQEVQVSKIMQEASDKCNELLGIYGLQTQIEYDIRPIQNNDGKQ